MDTELNRENIIQDLMNFSKETNETLSCFLNGIEWNENETIVKEALIVCPFDSNHRVPLDSLEDHLDRCQWKAEGYVDEDLPLSIPSVPPGAPSCIKFDEDLLKNVLELGKPQYCPKKTGEDNRLIPRTSDRFLADFTAEERKIIYDYVIGNTVQFKIEDEIADLNKPQNENGDGKKVSYLELVAQERNLKRRRAKHRGVHTNKKSHLEVMREVINHQMDMLAEYIAEKNPQPEPMMNKNGTDRLKESNNRDKIDDKKNYQRDYSEENQRRHESRRERDDYRDVERRDKSRHSKKSSRDYDRHEERHDKHEDRHRRDDKEKNYHSSRDRHHSSDKDHHHHHHHRHKSSKSKDHDRSRSRHDDDQARKRRKHRD